MLSKMIESFQIFFLSLGTIIVLAIVLIARMYK